MKLTDKIEITNEDNMELMARYPDNYFDLAIVDPPYGIGMDKNRNNQDGKYRFKKYHNTNWDNESPSKEYFEELFRVSKNQIIWGANHFVSKIPYDSSCWLVWDKNNGENDNADAELAWTSFKTAVRKYKKFIGVTYKNRIHPTQKPVSLYEWVIIKYAKEGDKILDTHLGSGSIAIACHNLGYDLTACELDKDYYDAAIKRIKQHTSQTTIFDLGA
jgi:site-specific DNA-methyltransferase (adenine-specific)